MLLITLFGCLCVRVLCIRLVYLSSYCLFTVFIVYMYRQFPFLVQFAYYNFSIHARLLIFYLCFNKYCTITHFVCPGLVTFTFVSMASFNVTVFFCCQSVSKERDTVLMNCEFSDPKEQMIMVTFIHLYFLIERRNSFCKCFYFIWAHERKSNMEHQNQQRTR